MRTVNESANNHINISDLTLEAEIRGKRIALAAYTIAYAAHMTSTDVVGLSA